MTMGASQPPLLPQIKGLVCFLVISYYLRVNEDKACAQLDWVKSSFPKSVIGNLR